MTSEPVKMDIPANVQELVSKWIRSASAYGVAHASESAVLTRRHTRIGAPSVALSAIVSTSIFAAIQEAAESSSLKWILALLSMVAASLAAIVTFYNYAAMGMRHKVAAEEYKDVARRLEVLKTSIANMEPNEWRNVLEGYSQQLEGIGKRVDLPSAMTFSAGAETSDFGMFPEVNPDVEVELKENVTPMRSGFRSELERVFSAASRSKSIKDPDCFR